MNTIKTNLWKKIQRFIFRRKRVIVKSKSELRDLIRTVIKEDGYDCNLNFIDTSNITDMSKLFNPEKGNDNKLKEEDIIFTKFNGDISKWDVSNVNNMASMFEDASQFNGDISKWDVSCVKNMGFMFSGASQFNGNISKWNVSNVRNMVAMFSRTKFNGDISNWNVSNVKNMKLMFNRACKFNSNISKWDVSNVTDMAFMFNRASLFNGDISKWDVSNVTDMAFMFNLASQFNSNISKWNVSKVKNMRGMFVKTKFNRDISKWDVSNVENMSLMFAGAGFDRDISNWNISNVTDMEYMFLKATNFSCNLSNWKPKEKVRTSRMFEGAKNFFSVTGIPKSLNHWNYYRIRDFPDEILCRVSPSGKKEYGYRADSYDMWKCKVCGTRFVCSSKPKPYSGIKPCNPSSTGKPKQHRWVLDNGGLSKDETFWVNYKANWTMITAQWHLRYEEKKCKQKVIKELNKLTRLL